MQGLRRFYRRAELTLAILAGVAMLAMVLITFLDVIGRYGFHHSIFGASEMIQWLMVAVVFGGIAFVTAEDSHINVNIFEPAIQRAAPRLSRWAKHLFSLAIYLLVTIVLWTIAAEDLASGRSTAVLAIPQGAFSLLAAVLASLGLVLFVIALAVTGGRPELIKTPHAVHGVE